MTLTGVAEDLADWLRLAAVPGLGAERQRSLLAAFGLPRHVFAAGRSALSAVVGRELADAVLAPPPQAQIEGALAWATEPGSHVLTLADEAYPRSLLDIADPPVLLYVKGDPALLQRPAIALVGARSATAQGEANAEAFARSLAEAGLTIVSGLALGVDAGAHRGALPPAPPPPAVEPQRQVAVASRVEHQRHGRRCSERGVEAAPKKRTLPTQLDLFSGVAVRE